jgi:F-type H+-transporting ATPase subunit c
MDAEAMKYLCIGLTVIGMFGAAMAISGIFSTLLNAIARNPSVEQQLFKGAFVGAGLAEAMGLFAFLLAILMLFFK